MLLWFLGYVVWLQLQVVVYRFIKQRHRPAFFGRRKVTPPDKLFCRFAKKPDWVKQEIIRMKALMPALGCRKLADSFNRRFNSSKQMTVGKTYVSNVIQKHEYDIQIIRKKLKHRKPKHLSKNLIWGMDLTGKMDRNGKLHNIFGIVDHGSRANLCLVGLKDKASITLLRHLLDAIERYGRPKIIRTDNESCFTSRLFILGLWILNIKQQKIDKACPWQNGRIERYFGTLKEQLNQWVVNNREQLNGSLVLFQFWYNHVRPHQHLNGRTPAEIWQGSDVYTQNIKKEYWFEAWDGLLTGYYLRL